jgi:hypothetical protein
MRANPFGWAVALLALLLSGWDAMAYHADMAITRPPDIPMQKWTEMMRVRRARDLPKYLGREALVLGGAVAAWLLVGSLTRPARP